MAEDDDFLSRWSRRKSQARTGERQPEEPAQPAKDFRPIAEPDPGAPSAQPVDALPPEPLPPVDSLTPDSDFRPFMKPEVEPGLRQQALKTLFRGANFNVMDGLDVYIDDYSKPDPLPASWLAKMTSAERLGDFVKTLLDDAKEADRPPPDGAKKNDNNQDIAEDPSADVSNTADAVVPTPPVAE